MAKRSYNINEDKLLNRKCDPARSYQCRRTCLRNSQKCDVKQSALSMRKLNEAVSTIRNSLGLTPRANNVGDIKNRYASLLATPISFTTGNELASSSRGQFSLMKFLKPSPTNVTGLTDLIDIQALALEIKKSGASGEDRTNIYLPPAIAAELEKAGLMTALQNSGVDMQARNVNTKALVTENQLENRVTGADTEKEKQQAVADMKREQDKSPMFNEKPVANTPGQLDCNQGNYACGGKCQSNAMKCPSKNFPRGTNKALSNGVASIISGPVPTPDIKTIKAEQERFKRVDDLMRRGKAERTKKAQEQIAKNPPPPPDMSAAIAEKKRREQKKKDTDSARMRLGGDKKAIELAQQEQQRRLTEKQSQTSEAARERLGGDNKQVKQNVDKAREAAKAERARRVAGDKDLKQGMSKQPADSEKKAKRDQEKEIERDNLRQAEDQVLTERVKRNMGKVDAAQKEVDKSNKAKDAAVQERAKRNMERADKAMQDIDKADPNNKLIERVQERMRRVDEVMKKIPEDVQPQIDDLLSNTDLTPEQQKEEAEKVADEVAKTNKSIDPKELAGLLLALLAIGSIASLGGGGMSP